MASELGGDSEHVAARGQDLRRQCKTLQIRPHPYIPIDVVLHNEGCGQILLYYTEYDQHVAKS